MILEKSQNQILPFFTPSKDENYKLNYINFYSEDRYNVVIVSSLTSKKLKNLDEYLLIGLEQVKVQFNAIDEAILDRMRESIYKGGDLLAEELMGTHQPVEDVDFAVGIFAFKGNILYVWIDGDINTRIYRGGESLLINSEELAQFNGSTNMQLGDVISISSSIHLKKHDENYESYVLENLEPEYPALFLDYQVEEEGGVKEKLYIPIINDVKNDSTEEQDSSEDNHDSSSQYSHTNSNNKKFSIKDIYNAKIKPLLLTANGYYLKSTSSVVDFLYAGILRKNNHQLKRFRESKQKKIFQYTILGIVLVLILYFVSNRSSAGFNSGNAPDKAVMSKNDNTIKTEIQAEFERLVLNYNNAEVTEFEQSWSTLQGQLDSARDKGFEDTSFLNNIRNQAQGYEDTLYKVTPISKVDGVFVPQTGSNAKIIDFDVVGNDVYAIDRENSQMLKSNSNQGFEVFASSSELKKLSKISCTEGHCYVLDEEAGLSILSFSTKKFNTYRGLTTGESEVKEMLFVFDSIYTLLPENEKVLKYTKFNDGFKAPVQWNTSPGFDASTQDIAIDGNVFELKDSGELKKYFNGKYDPSFKGLEESMPALGKDLRVAMTPARQTGQNRVYISDSENKRIAVYDKDLTAEGKFSFKGNYKYRGPEQVKFEKFDEIMLSKDEKYLYLLENNMVYKVSVTEV